MRSLKMVASALRWTITHDPYYLNDKIKNIRYEIDLGAEKLLAAERGSEKIAVESERRRGKEFHKNFVQTRVSRCFRSVPNLLQRALLNRLKFKDEVQSTDIVD